MRRLKREEKGMCRLRPLEVSERAWLCSFQCFLYICGSLKCECDSEEEITGWLMGSRVSIQSYKKSP